MNPINDVYARKRYGCKAALFQATANYKPLTL